LKEKVKDGSTILVRIFFFIYILDHVRGEINWDTHVSTGRCPIEVFRNRAAFFNNGLTRIEGLEDVENFDLEHDFEPPIFALNLEENFSNQIIHANSQANFSSSTEALEENEISNSNQNFEENKFPISKKYRFKYLNRMNKKRQVHGIKYKVGDKVRLAKDFDNNIKTRKRTFDGFFESESYKIKEILEHEQVKISRTSDNSEKIVACGRIKKANQK
jgi:hypothetical protein